MNDQQRKEAMHAALAMYESLQMAVRIAGGAPILVADLQCMTMMEFFSMFAPNGIRFHYDASPE